MIVSVYKAIEYSSDADQVQAPAPRAPLFDSMYTFEVQNCSVAQNLTCLPDLLVSDLAKLTSLKRLYLHMQRQRFRSGLHESLACHTRLTSLYINAQCMEVDMVVALLATGKLPHLRSLELVCKAYAGHASADVLPAAVARLTCLTQLVLDIVGAPEQRFGDPVPLLGNTLPQLQHLSNIRSLSLARIADDLDRIEVSKLTDVYEHMPLLQSLELVVSGLGPRTIDLGRALRAQGQLTHLSLDLRGDGRMSYVTHADQLCAELYGLATLESLALLLPDELNDDRRLSEPGFRGTENIHETVDLPVLSRLSVFCRDDLSPFPDIRKCGNLRQLDGHSVAWVRAMVRRGYKGGVQKLSLKAHCKMTLGAISLPN